MSKHTPGPWQRGTQDGLWIKTAKLSIAQVADQDMPEAEANARLIAAAPELLAALKGVLSHLAGVNWGNPNRNVYTVAKSAVAKAEEG